MSESCKHDEASESSIWSLLPVNQVAPFVNRPQKLGARVGPFIALAGAVPGLMNCFFTSYRILLFYFL